MKLLNSEGMLEWARDANIADESLINFLKDANYGTKDLASYQQYLKNTAKQTGIFTDFTKKAGSVVKSLGAALGSMAVMALAGVAISKTIEFINATKIAKQNAKDLVDSLKDMQETQSSNTSTISQLTEEYKKLSQGVNLLGENVSLTTNEYTRYQEICNQVANIMPDLVQSYDEQGNAILTVKGNLADLNAEYERYKQNQAIETYDDSDISSIFKNYNNEFNKASSMPSYKWNPFQNYIDLWATKDEQIDYLSQLAKLNNDELLRLSEKSLETDSSGLYTKESFLANTLRQYGLDKKSTEKEIETVRQNIKSDLIGLKTDIDKTISQISSIAITYGQQSDAYWGLDAGSKKYFQTVLNGLTQDFTESNSLGTVEGMQDFVNHFISLLAENKDGINDAFGELFNFDIKSTDLTPENIQEQINRIFDTLSSTLGLDKEGKKQLQVILGFDFVDGLAESYKKEIAKFADQDLSTYFKDNSINSEEEITYWQEITNGATSAAEAIIMYEDAKSEVSTNQPAPFSISDTDKKNIDDYQSKLSTLSTALENISSGKFKDNDLLDLKQQFPDLIGETGDLSTAITKLIDGSLDELLSALGENVPEDLVNLLKSIAEQSKGASEAILTIPEALNALQSSSTAIDNLNKNIKENKQITGDMIADLMSKYPQLTDVLNDYLLGVASTADVINALQGVYDNDVRNYQLACVAKKEYDTDFYNAVFAKLPDWIKELGRSYGIDLENFKNLAEAKAAVESKLIEASKKAWASYYSHLGKAESGILSDTDSAREEKLAQIVGDKAAAYEKAANDILNTFIDVSIDVEGINTPTFTSSGTGSKKDKSGSKDTKETINWIERKLDILEKKLSRLKDKADSVFGWSKKNNVVNREIKNLESQIKIYEKAQKSYKKEYSKIGLSKDIVSKIKNGSMDITAYDSKTAKKIKDYQDLYDKEQDCVDKVVELRQGVKDLNQEKLDNIKDAFDEVISNSNSRSSEIQARIDYKISIGEEVSESDYQELLKESKLVQDKLKKEIKEYQKQAEKDWKAAQKKYKTGSQEYKNAENSYKKQIAYVSDLNTKLYEEKQNQREINQAILEIPLRPLERQKELIEQQISSLDKLKSKYSDMIGVVTYYVGKQVDALNKAKSAITDTYDGMINPLKDQLEALQKQNEERQQAINLQKAQYELERARNQKTIRVLRNGIWDTEADLRKVREAEEAKDKASYDYTVHKLQNQINELESQRDNLLKGYDEQIERLNKISDKWSLIIQDAEMLSKIDMFESTYGSLENIINGSDVAYDKIKDSVEQVQKSLDDFNKAKDSLEDQIESIENYIKAWKNGEAQFSEVQNKITQVLSDHSSMNEDILLKSQETIEEYINGINGSTKELYEKLDKSVDDTKEKIQSMDKPLDDLQIALDKVVQGYDRFVKLNDDLTSTIPITVKEYVTLTDAADNLNTSVDNLSNKVTQFIPEMKKLDTVSVALKQSFETTSGVMQSFSTGAIEKITIALDKLFNSVYLLNDEFGVEGIKAHADYIAKLTATYTSVQQLDTLTKTFITTMKSLKTELNETQTAYKNLEIAMGLAMEKLNQISTSAASASGNFSSLAANINSAANAYYAFSDAQKASNSAGTSLLNSGGSIGLVGSGIGAAFGTALGLNSSIKGNALASGTRSAKEGASLVGEEEPELLIHNSRGTFELVDQPSLVNLDRGDTVLNGDETRDVLSSRMSTLNPALMQTIQIPKFSPPSMDVPTFGNKAPEGNVVYADNVIVECLKDRGEDDAKDLVFALTHMDGLIYQNKLKRR